MLLLLRELALVKVWTLGLVFKHCNTLFAHFCYFYLVVFIFSDYKNLYLLSILHLYHHHFAELTYTIYHCIGCVGDTRDSLLFGCRVAWERPSWSYASYGLINLRSSTWGKHATVLQNLRLEAQHESTIRRLHSRHQALFWCRCRGG